MLVRNSQSEKMRRITFSIWLVWLIISAINAELTLESVNQKVNDLEVEVTALKVNMTLKVYITRIVHGQIDFLTFYYPSAQAHRLNVKLSTDYHGYVRKTSKMRNSYLG